MTDPWAKVATAMGRDDAPGDEEHEGGQAPSGWGRIAEGLTPRQREESRPPSKAKSPGSQGKGEPTQKSKPRPPARPQPTSKAGAATRPPTSKASVAKSKAAPARSKSKAAPAKERTQPAKERRRPAEEQAEAADGPRRGLTRRQGAAGGGIIAVLIVIAVVLYLLLSGGGLPSGTAMSVGGRDVSVKELNTNIQILTKFYGITEPAQSDTKGYATFQKTAAKAYAIDLLLQKVAPAYQVNISSGQVQGELSSLVKTVANGNQSQLDQILSQYGLSETDLQNQIRLQLTEVALFNKVAGSPNPSAAQITQTFNSNQQALTVPPIRAVSHIVVADQATAQSIITQVNGGSSFATLASQQSLDTNSKANGGALGNLAQEQLSSAFGQAAFQAQVGVPFPVTEPNGGGYDVGLVTGIVNPGAPATNDIATQAVIRQYLVGVDKNDAWQKWLGAQLAKGHVRYATTYRPADPNQAPPTKAVSLRSLLLQSVENPSSSSSTTPPASTTP